MAEKLTDEQRELIHKLAKKTVDIRMSVPAVLFLEMHKPLSFVGSQLMVFFSPIVNTVFNRREYDMFAEIIEHRDNVEYLLVQIERYEDDFQTAERARKKAEREKRKDGKKGIKKYFSHRLW
ncbi:MAG: hypothetical protein D6675_01990 [Gemmatimonadetes bacterium]|nr:MAG: hypothetical protein D6675_01990 [Gemmatimonadota bacterium]